MRRALAASIPHAPSGATPQLPCVDGWRITDPWADEADSVDYDGQCRHGRWVLLVQVNAGFRRALDAKDLKAVDHIKSLRVAYPRLPLVVTSPAVPLVRELTLRLGSLGFARWVTGPQIDLDELLQALACIQAAHVVEWLSIFFPVASPGSVGTLHLLARYLADELPAGAVHLPGSLDRHLKRLSLPSPHRWVMLKRTLHALLDLQRDRNLTVARAAYDRCYSDPAQFRRDCRTLLGVSPSMLRRDLGWECILARFLEL